MALRVLSGSVVVGTVMGVVVVVVGIMVVVVVLVGIVVVVGFMVVVGIMVCVVAVGKMGEGTGVVVTVRVGTLGGTVTHGLGSVRFGGTTGTTGGWTGKMGR